MILVWDPAVISTALSPVHASAPWVLREFLCFFCHAFPSDNVLNVFPFFISISLSFLILFFSGKLFWHLGSNSGGKWTPCFLAWAKKVALVFSWQVWWRQKSYFCNRLLKMWLRPKLFGDISSLVSCLLFASLRGCCRYLHIPLPLGVWGLLSLYFQILWSVSVQIWFCELQKVLEFHSM